MHLTLLLDFHILRIYLVLFRQNALAFPWLSGAVGNGSTFQIVLLVTWIELVMSVEDEHLPGPKEKKKKKAKGK